jgi:flagellar FliJ protein
MKFEFQFEALLNIRRHEEKKQQQRLAVLVEQQLRLKNRTEQFKERLKKFEETVSNGRSQKAAAIRHQYELKHDLQKKIWQLQQKDRQLDEAIEQQRSRLIQANRNTRMLEKLENRERAKFIERHQHQVQLQQNEIATQIYNRSN